MRKNRHAQPIHRSLAWLATLWLCLPLATTAGAEVDPMPPQVREALDRFLETDIERWAYNRSISTDGETVVDHHDPSLPGEEHWQLVSIDGRAPTSEELEDYIEDRSNHAVESDDDRLTKEDIVGMVQPDSLRHVGVEDGIHRYLFNFRSPDGKKKKVYAQLRGEFRIIDGPDGAWIETVRVWNQAPISPVFGVRLEDVAMAFRFETRGEHVLPTGADLSMSGRAFLIKTIDREMGVDFTEIERPGQGAEQDSTNSSAAAANASPMRR